MYDEERVHVAYRNVVIRLREFFVGHNERTLTIDRAGVKVHTRLQLVFNLKFKDVVEQSIFELILSHALEAERMGPGGFDSCIQSLLVMLSPSSNGNLGNFSEKTIKGILWAGASLGNTSDLGRVIETNSNLMSIEDVIMIRRAIELAGYGGRIIVEKSGTSRKSVELIRGYTFDVSPGIPTTAKLERPRVFCIDGYVETVSEIHHLLHAANELKEPAVLFLRGMADEVAQTLKVNFDRGSLMIVPIIVKFDLEGINTLNDIAVVTAADCISSNKGDLISNIDFRAAPRIDEAIINVNRTVLKFDVTHKSVASHVFFLRNKRSEEKIDDVCRLLDKRIRSLSPNHVVIRLPDDKDFIAISQAIDYVLRSVKSLVDHGFVVVDGKRVLSATFAASALHALRCNAIIKNLGSFVTS